MNYSEILKVSENKLNGRKVSMLFDKLLNKTNVKRESNKAEVQHIVLAYLFSKGLLENGYIEDLSVDKITKELGISRGPVNTVLGVFGYKYERDRVTIKEDKGSNGFVDRYFKFEYIQDKTGNMVKKYSRSVFTLVVNEKLYDKLDELGVTDYNRIEGEELADLHLKAKEGSFVRNTVREHIEDMPSVYKETMTTKKEDGDDVVVSYHGLEEVKAWAEEKIAEQETEEEEVTVEEIEQPVIENNDSLTIRNHRYIGGRNIRRNYNKRVFEGKSTPNDIRPGEESHIKDYLDVRVNSLELVNGIKYNLDTKETEWLSKCIANKLSKGEVFDSDRLVVAIDKVMSYR